MVGEYYDYEDKIREIVKVNNDYYILTSILVIGYPRTRIEKTKRTNIHRRIAYMKEKSMKAFSKFYVKYIIKNSFIFYTFLLISVGTFIFLTLTIKINIVETYSATVEGETVKLNDTSNLFLKFEEAYVYKDRNTEVIRISESDIDFSNNQIYINLLKYNPTSLHESDQINVDIVVGQRTLLETIFLRAGGG